MSQCCAFDLPTGNDYAAPVASGLVANPKGPVRPCCVFNLPVVDDLQSRITIAPMQFYIIPIDCPPGYSCQQQTITTPPVVIPRLTQINGGYVMMQSCLGPVNGYIPAGATPALISYIAQLMQRQWAYNQAHCNVVATSQGVFNTMPRVMRVDVANDQQTATVMCPDGVTVGAQAIVPAGTFIQNLVGPNPFTPPTDAVIAQMKALVNITAQEQAQVEVNAMTPSCPSPILPAACGTMWAAYPWSVNPGSSSSGVTTFASATDANFSQGSNLYSGPSTYCPPNVVQTSGTGLANPNFGVKPTNCGLSVAIQVIGSVGGTFGAGHLGMSYHDSVLGSSFPLFTSLDIRTGNFVTGFYPFTVPITADLINLQCTIRAGDGTGALGTVYIDGTLAPITSAWLWQHIGPDTITGGSVSFPQVTNWESLPSVSAGGKGAYGDAKQTTVNLHVYGDTTGKGTMHMRLGYGTPQVPVFGMGGPVACNLNVAYYHGHVPAGTFASTMLIQAVTPGGTVTLLSGSMTPGNYPFTVPANATGLTMDLYAEAGTTTGSTLELQCTLS
jgi:hypothetical protein